MTHPLHIRSATEADLPALLDLYRHLTGDTPPPPDVAVNALRQLHLYPGSAILIATDGPAVRATCTLVVIPNLTRNASPYALIENVVTHPDHRNQGHGTAILTAAAERAWANNCYKIMLLTGAQNPATLAFYTNAGFAQSKTGFQMRRHPARTP